MKLDECYSQVAKVADYWLDVLYSKVCSFPVFPKRMLTFSGDIASINENVNILFYSSLPKLKVMIKKVIEDGDAIFGK